MKNLPCKLVGVFPVLITVGVLDCAGGTRGELSRVESPAQKLNDIGQIGIGYCPNSHILSAQKKRQKGPRLLH